MRRSLRGRLGMALGATAVLSVAITALISVGLVRTYAEDDAREDLRRIARALAGSDLSDASRVTLGFAALRRVLDVNGDRMLFVSQQGFRDLGPPGPPIQIEVDALLEGEDISGTVDSSDGRQVYVGVPVRLRPRAQVQGVVLLRPLRSTSAVLGPVIGRVALAGVAAVLAAVVLSLALARRLTKPVRELSTAASRIAHGDLSQQVVASGGDELSDLAHSFNDMSRALAESQRREREFLASVSHELRTPLTAIRGYAEALQDGALHSDEERSEAVEVIRTEAERLGRMVTDVMDLARFGAKEFSLDLRDADVAAVIAESVAAHRAAAEERGITLSGDASEELVAFTDVDRMRQIVANLVENAIRVLGDGGSVRVSAREEHGRALVEVTDDGPGIAAEDLPHVFERSYLWRASKGSRAVGTGLGLAIVRELILAVRGTVEVISAPGQGTTFRITLPGPQDARAVRP